MDKDKQKIVFTIISVAMVGAVVSNFFHEHSDSSICKIIHSNGFALGTGLLVAYTYFLY
jgi:hypothetical protein